MMDSQDKGTAAKMKIVFITSESMLDHSYTMINELRKAAELDAYILAKSQTAELAEYCRRLGVNFVKRLSFSNPFSLLKEIKFFKKLKSHRADIVWFNRTTFYQTLIVRFFFRNFLINVHDVELHPEEKDYHGIITQKLIFAFFKKHIAVMSKTQQGIFEKKYGFKPYLLQLPVIDYYKEIADHIDPGAGEDNKVKFFFFGSVMPYKGIEKLLEAAEMLAAKYDDFSVGIYGKINYNRQELESRIRANSKITLDNRFIDYKDIATIFSANDVIIIPYIQVSQCGPLLIAYAQNVPVITSSLPGFREYVDDGQSGFMFSGTPEDLFLKMEQFILNRNLLNTMKDYISGEITKKFSMQSLAQSYLNEFRKASGAEKQR